MNFTKFLRTAILQNISEQLPLNYGLLRSLKCYAFSSSVFKVLYLFFRPKNLFRTDSLSSFSEFSSFSDSNTSTHSRTRSSHQKQTPEVFCEKRCSNPKLRNICFLVNFAKSIFSENNSRRLLLKVDVPII